MRPSRSAALALALLALASGCARRASRAASSPVRFVAADAAAVVVAPSLEALAQQASDALATAATFPGGQAVLDGRAVLQARLGFDPFDPASLAGAGLDPKRGVAVGVRASGTGPDARPDVTISLPVADAARFDATVSRLARERLRLTARSAAGTPEVITWRDVEGGAVQLAYAIAERTAVVASGPRAVEDVRAALAVPADAHIGTAAAFRSAQEAAGPGLAVLGFVPPGSPLARESPQLRDGFALGLRGAKDRLDVVGCRLLGAGEAAVKSAARGESRALLAKLHPDASIVARGEGDLQAMLPPDALLAILSRPGAPDGIPHLVGDAYGALGNGSALGLGVVPVAKGSSVPLLGEAPLRFLRVELVLAVKDPARMKDAVRRAVAAFGAGRMRSSRDGSWTAPLPGGELGVAVDGGRLMVAAGPVGSLQALAARTGSTFQGPTPISARALDSAMGGMVVDVGKLAASVAAIPAAAYGTGMSSGAIQSSVQQWASTAARVPAVSATSELLPGAQRSTVVIEVLPPR